MSITISDINDAMLNRQADRIRELESKLSSRDAEIAELKADAMRYRWLCHRDATKDIAICEWVAEEGDWYALGMSKQPVDAIIDREIAKVMKL